MAPVTHTLLVTPVDALPCPPRFLTPKDAFNVVWVRAELSGAGEGLGHRYSPVPMACLSHSAEPLHGQQLPAGRPAHQPAPAAVVRATAEVPAAEGVGAVRPGRPSGGWQWACGRNGDLSTYSCCPQSFSNPLPSPAGMLEPLVLDGKELPQVCVGAESPEGPGCRVLFHVLPLEAGLTPDILIPPGELEGCVCMCVCMCACSCVRASAGWSDSGHPHTTG